MGDKHLNQVGKEVLIKSMIRTIPVYSFSCFKAHFSLCYSLNSIVSKFWWKNNESGKAIHWGAWSKLNAPKSEGGLGFKDFASFNTALLAKQFWRLQENPNAAWSKILKGIYFPRRSCWEARKVASPSWIWSNLLEGRSLIQQGVRWNVGDGASIQFWEDNWVNGLESNKVVSGPPPDCLWTKGEDFINTFNKT